MIAEIEAAKKDGDTLGGSSRWLPTAADRPGLVHQRRQPPDSQLAGAVMGIQAIKGVEIGDGFETARRRGSAAHDEMVSRDLTASSVDQPGRGLEGGMTNGQPCAPR